ncbi:MAG: formate dehydrogenase accessory sulfurtransferase FdhD [Bacteroidia bacterium]|nr:formate dehydrogenase accessory sulfurtransferase FdhD [Bacteroidia bacterium]
MDNEFAKSREINRFIDGKSKVVVDSVAIEEPLEISLTPSGSEKKNISITMRTPGNDNDLAIGFLFTEGIVSEPQQLLKVITDENKVNVHLKEGVSIDFKKLERHFYTSSSCGVCGKSSIESIRTVCSYDFDAYAINISSDIILSLPGKVRQQQDVFEQTGGLHACALFDTAGKLLTVFEDIGRHNALDKLIGHAFQQNMLPLNNHLLLLSGRASFELIQKAAMAGIRFVMAVGAPSSLAIELAEEFGLTLLGFLNENRYNVYTGNQRIIT